MNNAIALDLSRCSTEVSGGREINSLLGRLAMKVAIAGPRLAMLGLPNLQSRRVFRAALCSGISFRR
jgi:hypothetical protein